MVFLLAYTGVVSPVDAAFLPTRFDAIFFINRLLDLSFFIDLILQFNIAYVAENGVGLVKNRRKIAFRYLCGWFCFDLFSVCPFDLLNFMVSADVTNLQALKTLRLAKMLRLLRANRLFERIEVRMAVNYSACRLYAFGLMLFLFIHWFACGWFMVIDFENNEECIESSTGECCYNWRDCYAKQQETSTGDYFLSIYWSSSEVLTTTSDVYPVTDLERAYQVLRPS
ncbi:hypothetical protein CYMTET_45280 [Cymbomonas tetramitiformis]|uniref:Ion transport domain-containing protein n=1 Tax=Cymbomonas tetramitiformis TaxID=36881 RepID=A0AAE0EYS2_9CHLO|nr:hypothetical protein CYMTET_45280 [Cymbomonas tetramitiformis]